MPPICPGTIRFRSDADGAKIMNFICADAVKWANEYDGPLFHGLLSDTPYNLESITRRFGKDGAAPARPGTDGAFVRASKGFMNQDWDTDIAFQVSTWEAFKRVLHPGAFGFAFSGSRTWHRMAVAIEDAGFIIHPTIFLWAFGSGFPKATQVKDERFKVRVIGMGRRPSSPPLNLSCASRSPMKASRGRLSSRREPERSISTAQDSAVTFRSEDGRPDWLKISFSLRGI